MKKSIGILIITIIVIILILTSLVLCAQSNKNTPSLEDKVSEEIIYLNNYIISLLGDFNGLIIGDSISEKGEEVTELEKEENTITSNINTQQQSQTNNTEEKNTQNQGNETNSSGGGDSKKESSSQEETNSSSTQQSNQDKDITKILANNGKYTANWKKIQEKVENLYQIWNTISIDLHALNVDGQSILNFTNYLNSATQYVKKQDKEKAMEQLTSIYNLLPQYMQSYSVNELEAEMLRIQSFVVSAYTNITNSKWDNANEQLIQAEQQFSNIINSVSQNYENQTVISQSYILVNELISAVNLKDKEIFYIQFQNLVSKISVLI